ncbi:hypothetical protein HK096_008549 [Nowakowskiella sp. JEL0078]|nr:hypothetical protein HK096_008549 [Nowakowskiella sp. JEL0078]
MNNADNDLDPLLTAISRGRLGLAVYLLQFRSVELQRRRYLLDFAVSHDLRAVLRLFGDLAPETNTYGSLPNLYTPENSLQNACANMDVPKLLTLLAWKGDPNATRLKNDFEKLPLVHIAVTKRSLSIVAYLLQFGADPNIYPNSGKPALDIAIANKDLIIELALRKKGANGTESKIVNLQAIYNSLCYNQNDPIVTAIPPDLKTAVGIFTPSEAKTLLTLPPVVLYCFTFPQTSTQLGRCVILGSSLYPLIQPLYQKQPPESRVTLDSMAATLLHLAAEDDNVPVLEYLFQHFNQKRVFNSADAFGNTALHVAAISGAGNAFEFLVKVGVDRTKLNSKGLTAVNVAAFGFKTTLLSDFIPAPNLLNNTEDWVEVPPLISRLKSAKKVDVNNKQNLIQRVETVGIAVKKWTSKENLKKKSKNYLLDEQNQKSEEKV